MIRDEFNRLIGDFQFHSPTLYVIGNRMDNWPGHGTYADPFDGSTQIKFDALMTAAPDNSDIFIMPSPVPYMTKGSYGFHVKNGQRIRGGGIGATVIKLVTSVTSWVIDGQTGVSNSSLSDLTLDCDFVGNKLSNSAACGAVFYSNGNCSIRNVRVINCGTVGSGQESFGLAITGTGGRGDVVNGCVVEQFQSGGTNGYTAILMGSNIGGLISDNTVVTDDASIGFKVGIGFGGVKDLIISRNHVYGGTDGIYSDTGINDGVFISENILSSNGQLTVFNGIDFLSNPGVTTFSEFHIVNNQIKIIAFGTGIVFRGSGQPFSKVRVENNYVRLYDPLGSGSSGMSLGLTNGLKIKGNVNGNGLSISVVGSTLVWGTDNTNESGGNIQTFVP